MIKTRQRYQWLVLGLLIGLMLSGLTACGNRSSRVRLDMDRIIEASSDQTNWPETVTGVWGDANAAFEDASFAGYLVLVDDGGRITGVSTTGNSIWRGRFVNGVLTATYNGQYGNGSVRLELSDDGSTLTGTWESGDSRGTYTAVRATQIDRNELINHLQERMGEWLEIRE